MDFCNLKEIAIITAKQLGLDEEKYELVLEENIKKFGRPVKTDIPILHSPHRFYDQEYLQQFIVKCSSVPEYIAKNAPKTDGMWTKKPAVVRKKQDWNKDDSSIESNLKIIRSGLNKIAADNEVKLTKSILENVTEKCITSIITFFFERGSKNKIYMPIYARLSVEINKKFPDQFKKDLLLRCKKEFETFFEGKDENETEKHNDNRTGSIYFLVELLRVRLINPTIIILCANTILKTVDCGTLIHASNLILTSLPLIQNSKVRETFVPVINIIKKSEIKPFAKGAVLYKIAEIKNIRI